MHSKMKKLKDIEHYLIDKAWEIRRTGEFDDFEIAKLIMKGKINV